MEAERFANEGPGMKQSVSTSPINSILFIEDRPTSNIPVVDPPTAPAWATPDCIIIKAYPEQDGPTDVLLGDHTDVDPGRPPDFTSMLRTPGRRVLVRDALDQAVITMPSDRDLTRIAIWLSHPEWPEKVIIGLD
ncbi:hypothetical protein [Phreatobacter sp.]|uniref:hypothetical protein n=1 Tax=Phreatobacter sp. TaxID=1966341 RepID=UPI0022CA6697|nr:hypothetical protein [Phreatobacter sp.]MCZ8314339.1 hypothetical protein [Phreatobacter sp.]